MNEERVNALSEAALKESSDRLSLELRQYR